MDERKEKDKKDRKERNKTLLSSFLAVLLSLGP
jgi:hypothetical protein